MVNAVLFNAFANEHLLDLPQHCWRARHIDISVRGCGKVPVEDQVDVSGFAFPSVSILRMRERGYVRKVPSAAGPHAKLMVEEQVTGAANAEEEVDSALV